MVTAAVTILVWLVASQAHLSDAYVGVVIALALLIVVGAIVGLALGRFLDAPAARSSIFAASMRDFAIASGIATAAFGAAAAAPLGLYGIMVMLWGTGLAGTLRHRPAGPVGNDAPRLLASGARDGTLIAWRSRTSTAARSA